MVQGYTKPLYILPFDHRASYISGLFGLKEPLDKEQTALVSASKQVIYEGFKRALEEKVDKNYAGILVDEEFGSAILKNARDMGYIFAYSVEKSGQEEFDFQYGEDFAKHIEAFQPTFAKVLVRYNPEGDEQMNSAQRERLKRLSDYLQQSHRLFMFELLIPPEKMQLDKVDEDKEQYDLQIRPRLLIQTIHTLQDAGIEPDVWKIEGLDRHEDCEKAVQAARRGGRNNVGLIVLGRGANQQKVVSWLKTAAGVPGFIGFAVGRTSFWDSLGDFEKHKISRGDAALQIAKNFESWVQTFESARTVSI